MDRNGKEFLICDCEGTMALDAKALVPRSPLTVGCSPTGSLTMPSA